MWENTKLEPNILRETTVKVFNGTKKEELTILTIDAGSLLHIFARCKLPNDQIDYYQYAAYMLQYRVKEIEDGKEFLDNNSQLYLSNILKAINNVDNGKETGLKIIRPNGGIR